MRSTEGKTNSVVLTPQAAHAHAFLISCVEDPVVAGLPVALPMTVGVNGLSFCSSMRT